MKKKRFSVEQIVGVLKQVEMGVPVAELIRQIGISEQTLYRWKKQYRGLETDQVRQIKQLLAGIAKLRRIQEIFREVQAAFSAPQTVWRRERDSITIVSHNLWRTKTLAIIHSVHTGLQAPCFTG